MLIRLLFASTLLILLPALLPLTHNASAFGAGRSVSSQNPVVSDTLEHVREDSLKSGDSPPRERHGALWFDAGIGGAFGPDISGLLFEGALRYEAGFGSIKVAALTAFQPGAYFDQALDKITEVRILYGYPLDIARMRLLFSGGFARLTGDVLQEGISYRYGITSSGVALEARIFLIENGTVYRAGVLTAVTLTDQARFVHIALVFAF